MGQALEALEASEKLSWGWGGWRGRGFVLPDTHLSITYLQASFAPYWEIWSTCFPLSEPQSAYL